MYGQGHLYCQGCGHAVRNGRQGCGSCGTPLGELMMLDLAIDQGYTSSGIGFDPLDGQFAVNLGDGLAFEPGTGQVDIDFGGIDIPL